MSFPCLEHLELRTSSGSSALLVEVRSAYRGITIVCLRNVQAALCVLTEVPGLAAQLQIFGVNHAALYGGYRHIMAGFVQQMEVLQTVAGALRMVCLGSTMWSRDAAEAAWELKDARPIDAWPWMANRNEGQWMSELL